jgi:hypothetical protein
LTDTTEVKIGTPLQVPLFGPKSLKVIDPVGAPPVLREAWSKIELPSVVDAGCALVVKVAAHGPLPGVAGALNPSTLTVYGVPAPALMVLAPPAVTSQMTTMSDWPEGIVTL